jgi:hypothetical protein
MANLANIVLTPTEFYLLLGLIFTVIGLFAFIWICRGIPLRLAIGRLKGARFAVIGTEDRVLDIVPVKRWEADTWYVKGYGHFFTNPKLTYYLKGLGIASLFPTCSTLAVKLSHLKALQKLRKAGIRKIEEVTPEQLENTKTGNRNGDIPNGNPEEYDNVNLQEIKEWIKEYKSPIHISRLALLKEYSTYAKLRPRIMKTGGGGGNLALFMIVIVIVLMMMFFLSKGGFHL